MEAKELFALMDDKNVKARQPKCVPSLYASRMSAIAHKLSPEEMADMMELGVIIARARPGSPDDVTRTESSSRRASITAVKKPTGWWALMGKVAVQ